VSTPINDGGPAFPSVLSPNEGYLGMTLRDWFAGQALCGLLARAGEDMRFETAARESYGLADAMLKARVVLGKGERGTM
jgi:hypothetical protein